MSAPETFTARLGVRTVATACGLVAMAVICTFALVLTEISDPNLDIEVVAFVVAGLGLVVCERTPSTWIRFGQVGVVTPLWLFAFIMVLLGSPALTVGIASLGAALHAVRYEPVASDMVARVSATAVSLSAAGLVLEILDPTMSPTSLGESSWSWAGAVAIAGVSIVVLNAFTAALWLSARRRSSFISLLRHGLASRVTAEGAMLSLAPVWVIALDLNPVLLPILAITTILVFRSTRQAFERANENRADQLTGLLNQRAFLELVDEALHVGSGRYAVVMLMDLNGFKEVNDRLGHQMGDALLIAFGERLDAARPDGAAVARLGGDEFAILIRQPRQNAYDLVAELHELLTVPLALQGFPVTAGVSIGVACSPTDGVTSADLVRAADVAMYKAKRTRMPFVLYEHCSRTPQHGRTNLLPELSDALARHRLHINYQPQIRIADGSVDTLEALVRWDHPEYGFVPPDEFIGLAEQTDLIGPITDMVLRSATQGLMAGSLTARLAVNVSPRSLEDPRFTDQLFSILAESSFPPTQLELEITERALARNPERTRYTVAKLRSEGVRIAIDDFGIGYSSYQTLRTLDVDRVKIDRAFVQGVLASDRDRVIVASLIDLAHDLGLDVVAEGVEGELVWNELARLGCDVAQGFGIAVPMTYIDVREWLKQWSLLLAADRQQAAVHS